MKFEITFGIRDASGFVTYAVDAKNRGDALRQAMDSIESGDSIPKKLSLSGRYEFIDIVPPPPCGPMEYVIRVRHRGKRLYYSFGEGWVSSARRATKFTKEGAREVCVAVSHGDLSGLAEVVRVRPRGGVAR